jgi:hypothetical protein
LSKHEELRLKSRLQAIKSIPKEVLLPDNVNKRDPGYNEPIAKQSPFSQYI